MTYYKLQIANCRLRIESRGNGETENKCRTPRGYPSVGCGIDRDGKLEGEQAHADNKSIRMYACTSVRFGMRNQKRAGRLKGSERASFPACQQSRRRLAG